MGKRKSERRSLLPSIAMKHQRNAERAVRRRKHAPRKNRKRSQKMVRRRRSEERRIRMAKKARRRRGRRSLAFFKSLTLFPLSYVLPLFWALSSLLRYQIAFEEPI